MDLELDLNFEKAKTVHASLISYTFAERLDALAIS